MPYRALLLLAGLLALAAIPGTAQGWHTTTAPCPYLNPDGTPLLGKDGNPVIYTANLSLPDGIAKVRGLLIGGTFANDTAIRSALADLGMGTLTFSGNPDGLFDYASRGSGPRLERDLGILAAQTGHPEIAFAPLMTVGFSTGGIYCRNIAYWNPSRMIGVLHMKSGNLQAHIQDMRGSLAGVPFLAVNGECEQYGPDGGELKAGHRALYSLDPADKSKNNQTQWIMMRMQLLERRRRNQDNLMGLVVQHTSGKSDDHTSWDPGLSPLLAQFIRSAAAARIPKDAPEGKPVVCTPLKAEDGWLIDADIKAPRVPPASYKEFTGDRNEAFWFPDQVMAAAVAAYHARPWAWPDPTASFPADQRFKLVDARLRDILDIPKPLQEVWGGGDGVWDEAGGCWSRSFGAEFLDPKGGTMTLASDINANGLTIGPGYTLVLGRFRLNANWHGVLKDGCTINVTLAPGDKGDRALRLWGAGNLDLAGTLIITAEGALPEGDYRVVNCNGKLGGAFTKLTAPAGYTATMTGGVVTLKKAN